MKVIEAVLSGIELWQVVSFLVTGAVAWGTTVFFQARKVIRTVKETEEKVKEITTITKRELQWNGGLSIKDTLDALSASFGRMEAWNTALLNQSGIAAWRTDACGDVDWVNAAFTHQTGMGIEHLRGSLWLSMVCEDDRARVEGQWLKCIERASPFMTTFMMPPGDDNCETVLMQAQPFFSPQKQGGKLLGFAGTIQITGKQ